MYNTVNKNYRIDSYSDTGEYIGATETDGILQFYLNNVCVIIVPHYDTGKYLFPPTEELYDNIGENVKNEDEIKIMSFVRGDLVFFEHPLFENKVFKVENTFISDGMEIEDNRLIYCISSEDYQLLITEIPKILDEYNTNNDHGRWQRNDVMDRESFQLIDKKIREFTELLPKNARRSFVL